MWVSPMNSPVRLGVSPAATTPTGFYRQRFWGFLFLCWVEWSVWLLVSAPPTGLDECFFFYSLVVGLPYSLIFWQSWLFFVFKFVVVLLLVV